MQNVIFLLTSLACAGSGRRAQAFPRFQGLHDLQSQKPLKVVDMVPTSVLQVGSNRSHRQAETKGCADALALLFLAFNSAAAFQPGPTMIRRMPRSAPRARVPVAFGADTLVLGVTFLLSLGTIALVVDMTAGPQGLGAFLNKEKGDNPFYDKNFKPEERQSDGFLVNLIPDPPDLPFVEVYGRKQKSKNYQTGSSLGGLPEDIQALYQELDKMIDAEKFDEAAAIKEKIDAWEAGQR